MAFWVCGDTLKGLGLGFSYGGVWAGCILFGLFLQDGLMVCGWLGFLVAVGFVDFGCGFGMVGLIMWLFVDFGLGVWRLGVLLKWVSGSGLCCRGVLTG